MREQEKNESSWLIVGGGIHGVHVAAQLIGKGGVAAEKLQMLDPGKRLLERWRYMTSATGMTHLRSPGVHHLGPDPWSLFRFAGRKSRRKRGSFAHPYNRPSLALFDAHCDRVIADHDLESTHVRGWASECRVESDGVTVLTRDGRELRTGNLVFAIGASEQPELPRWAPENDSRVRHIFDRELSLCNTLEPQPIAVVGGGITAAQVALLHQQKGNKVHWISRHALRHHQFDSDPGWLGPKLMDQFQREPNIGRRRAMITAARHRGSLPSDLSHSLRLAINTGGIVWHQRDVKGVDCTERSLLVRLNEGTTLPVERMVLATGFSRNRPGGALLDNLIETTALPCAPCGYPIVDYGLRWHPRIRVTGPLAELELGPTARNIAGARRAGERIVQSLRRAGNVSLRSKGEKNPRFRLRQQTSTRGAPVFTDGMGVTP